MSFFSRKKKHSEAPSTSAPASGLLSSQLLQFPTDSQSQSQSPHGKQQPQPICSWSAHAPPLGQSPSPFLRNAHALSTSATAAGELFLFGGYVDKSRSGSNGLYVISTRDFSTSLLQTSGDIPSPRYAHRAVLTKTTLLIWGGWTDFSNQNAQKQGNDDSFYLLNLSTSDLFMSRLAPVDQSFLCSSIARVDPHRDQWSRTWRSFLPHHDVGRFQALRLRWPDRQEAF